MCEIEDIYTMTDCSKCGSYICLACNLFIPENKVKVINGNEYTHLEQIFKKHKLKCDKSTINEIDLPFVEKYCNGCKRKYGLIDVIE
jgi:hypothetical protein